MHRADILQHGAETRSEKADAMLPPTHHHHHHMLVVPPICRMERGEAGDEAKSPSRPLPISSSRSSSLHRPSVRQQAKHGHDDPPKNGEKEFTISRPCPNSTLEEYTTLGAWGNRRLFVVFLRKIVKTSPSVRLGQLVITWMCVWTQYRAARNRNEEALPPPPPFHPSFFPLCFTERAE